MIPNPDKIHPPLAELRKKRDAVNAKRHPSVEKARALRHRIDTEHPQGDNAVERRIAEIAGLTPPAPRSSDHDHLLELLREIHDYDRAIDHLDTLIQRELHIASRMICDSVRPEHSRLVKDFAKALTALHASHLAYDQFVDSVAAVASVGPLGKVSPTGLGNPKDRSGTYYYSFREMVDAGHIAKSDVPKALIDG